MGGVNGEGVKSGSSCVSQVIITVPRGSDTEHLVMGRHWHILARASQPCDFSLVKLSISEILEQVSIL